MSDTNINTGNLLRPSATRPTGAKAWVWYAGIGLLCLIIIVYVISAFAAPPKHDAADGVGSGPTVIADQTFRYAGRTVDSDHALRSHPKPLPTVAGGGNGSGGSGNDSGQQQQTTNSTPTAVPVMAYNVPSTQLGTDVISQARASQERIPLPTAAPDDGPAGSSTGGGSASRIKIVFGAPAEADSPVPINATSNSLGAAGVPAMIAASTTGQPSTPESPAATGGGLGGNAQSVIMPGARYAPTSRYMVVAGTKIYCQLDVAIQSDIPGPVSCHVVVPVVDSLTGIALIPAGSTVLGSFNNAAKERIGITWTRLIFPDRSWYPLTSTVAIDEDGHVGIGGKIDDHRAAIIRTTLISAVLATIAQRLSGSTGSGVTVVTGGTTSTTSASAQMLVDAANQLNARYANQGLTVNIPSSSPLELYIDRDMPFEGGYAPMKAAQ